MSDEASDIPEVIVSQNGDHAQDNGAFKPNGDAAGEGEIINNNARSIEKEPCDESVQILTGKLTAALKEIISKDNLVKQHAKVAEDAISGWEKAEAEAALLKQQLESSQQQKLTLDERVAHLDGALKECVKQLRTGREDQEQKQAEIEDKVRAWDRVRGELEARLAEAEEQVLAVSSENAALEQRVADAKNQADADVKKTSAKMETLEKENAALKHDVRSLKKDLVGLNNESKKASEAAKQQLLESSRKASRLEADCQRYKIQLRKKASPQVRESDVLDRRKSLGRIGNSPRAFSEAAVDDASEMSTRDFDEKFFAMEEESKSLKDELAKRNKELQAAKIMCARTASKLLSVEEQLASVCKQQDISGSDLNGHIEALRAFGNNGSCNGDDADAWASALISELAQFKKDDKKADKLLDTTSFELMDDFLEMEKLTSNVVQDQNGQVLERKGSGNKDLDAANEVIMALRKKIAALESQALDNGVANGHGHGQTDCENGDVDQADADQQKEKTASLIWRIFQLMEVFGQRSGVEYESKPASDSENGADRFIPSTKWEDSNVHHSFEKLAAAGDLLLQGNADFYSFVAEICNTLDVLTGLQPNQPDQPDRDRVSKLESALAAAGERVSSSEQDLAREQDAVAAMQSERALLLESASKTARAFDELAIEKKELEEKLTALTVMVNELTSKTGDLEDNAKSADEQAKIVNSEFEKTLEKEISAREMLQQELDAMNGIVAELEARKNKMDEEAKTHRDRIESLELELKRGRHDKLATQKDIDAVNEDIQTLMADFVQLQREKRDLEEALAESARQRLEETNKTNVHLETISGLEEDLRHLLEQEHESRKSIEETKAELNKYLQQEESMHRSLSEKEDRCAELELALETVNAERTLVDQRVNEQVNAERGRVSSLQEEIGGLELQNVRLEAKLRQSDEDLKEQEASFISLQTEFYQLKIEKEEMEHSFSQKLQQIKIKLAAAEEESERLKSEHEEIRGGFIQDVERVKGDFTRSDRELKESIAEKELLLDEIKTSAAIAEETKETCSKLEIEVIALRESSRDLERQLQDSIESVRRLEAECGRLESEKLDLEHVLAATNEIVQGVKEECSRLSIVEQELKEVRAEKDETEESMKQVIEEFKILAADKAELEHDLALSQVTWKSQVFEGEEVVASLRAELGLCAKSRQLAEDQLAESFSAKAELQYEVKAAAHAAAQLEERAKVLEEELGRERSKSRAAAAELDDLLQQQLSGSRTPNLIAATTDPNDDKNVDLAAKLDECHRAILNLGEQLQSLSTSKSCQSPAVQLAEPSTSEESINNAKLKPDEAETATTTPTPTPSVKSTEQSQELGAAEHTEEQTGDAKVFVPSLPLEGRSRSKSTSPAKSKLLKAAAAAASASRELDLTRSLDMGSPSEKPSSSAFSRFFRGKSSSSSHHHS